MDKRKPWGFCETPEAKCTMNYCDENGCQNRKRTYAPLKSESEDISARAEEYVRKYIKGNVIDFSVEVEVVKSFIEGYKSCLAAQSQSVEESKGISIKRFLINKGVKSNTEQISILRMVELVDEWQALPKISEEIMYTKEEMKWIDVNERLPL